MLLVNGATAVIRRGGQAGAPTAIRIRRLLGNKPAKVAAVVIANRTVRIAWAMPLRKEESRRPVTA